MNETLMTSAFPWTDMVGNELPWRQRLFTSDGVSFRVGPVRVRQVRMPHCKYMFLFSTLLFKHIDFESGSLLLLIVVLIIAS